jgi:hypothetical protein
LATKWRGTAKFLIIVDFPDFWKINGWNALTLWTPISCCAPGLLAYSYYFAYILPTISSQDRLSNKAEVFFGFSQTPTCLLMASPVFPGVCQIWFHCGKGLIFVHVFVWTQNPEIEALHRY